MLHSHKFLKTLLSKAVKKMQLNKQLEPLKMLLLLVCPALSFNVSRLCEFGDVVAIRCQPNTNVRKCFKL